ncbi:MAG: Wzz/FepE/Etk N-terminal domain-containing protein [Lachnospiraceae bacterium]
MNEQYASDEIEIDLKDVVITLWRKALVIVLCTFLTATIAYVTSKFLLVPQYESTSTIYILTKTTSVTSLTDFQIGEQITVDFTILAETQVVLERVIDELGLELTYEELLEKLEVTVPSDSRLLQFTVTDSDPTLATQISNSMATQVADRVAEVMVTDKPSIVQPAVVPEDPASPNTLKNTLIGALIGMFLSVGVILLIYFLDDTIKTEEDVEKYLKLNVLAALPIE